MPVQPTYPGVYIEESPTGVRMIKGVDTSITAFVGQALKGELNTPIAIKSFTDFKMLFGGLWFKSMISYAVRDFYTNGGTNAIIVRIAKDAKKAILKIPTNLSSEFLTLQAISEGEWGNTLIASTDHNTTDILNSELFNISIAENIAGGGTEKFSDISINKDDPRYVVDIIRKNSILVRVIEDSVPAERPIEIILASVKDDDKGSDGTDVSANEYSGNESKKTGFYALQDEAFNLLCVPPPTRTIDIEPKVYVDALTLCASKRAMLIVDSPAAWGDVQDPSMAVNNAVTKLQDLQLSIPDAKNAALFFPRIRHADTLADGQIQTFAPCGIIAGIIARTDISGGVWRSPAGMNASLNGIDSLQVNISDEEGGRLNALGINVLRSFPVTGPVVWGARTLRGADNLADEYKYIAVRRTALFIEESIYQGIKWVVFEPNGEPLWAQIRLSVGAFMYNLFRQGAFEGSIPGKAYFVKCDSETTSQTDIGSGTVNILVGFAPLKPAEFITIKIQQLAGQTET